MRPGPNVKVSTALPPATLPTNTGTGFMVGVTASGPQKAILITSFAQYQRIFGSRGTAYQRLSDSVETAFNEGAARIYIGRAVGASAKAAKAELESTGAKKVLVVEANGAGTWGNSLKIVVATEGSGYTIEVQNASAEQLEISPLLLTTEDAVTWARRSSEYLNITVGAEPNEPPKAATTSLATGTDDETHVELAQYEAALNLFIPALGPGQVAIPGVSTATVQKALAEIAYTQNRVAVIDAADKATKTELKTAASALRGIGIKGRTAAFFADWQDVAPASGSSVTRSVPPSAFVLGKCSENDAVTKNPNLPIAGRNGILPNSLGKHAAFTPAEVEELFLAGVNLCKLVGGQVRLYGFRTVVNPVTEPVYTQFNNSRLDMAILWRGLAIAEEYVQSEIDGQGHDAGRFGADLTSMMLEYFTLGAVFGESPGKAFSVDVGSDVNNATTAENGELNATIACRRSKGAEQVNINVVRVALSQEL